MSLGYVTTYSLMCLHTTVPPRDNVALAHVLLMSELIYPIEQCDYNLVNMSVLHSMLDVYRVYYMRNRFEVLESSAYIQ